MIHNYKNFLLNEAIVRLSSDLITKIMSIYTSLDDVSKSWVNKIIDNSGKDIDSKKLDNDNSYLFDISSEIEFFDMQVKKPKSTINQEYKMGRALKLLVPEIPPHILSNITSALQADDGYEVDVVDSYEISNYYNYDNISSEGTLARSCMNEVGDDYFELYDRNKGVVKLAILLDEDETLIARALLWKTSIGWVMDRVYYASDKYEYLFIKWCNENDYTYYKDIDSEVSIKLNYCDFGRYPYLDTFNYISFNNCQLSNSDIFDESDEVAILSSTHGEYEVVRNVEIPFEGISSLDEYKWTNDLRMFINYSIDNDKWLKDAISNELDNYYSYPEDFLNAYDYYIEDSFNKLNLEEVDKDIDLYNYKEMIEDFADNYKSKYEDIVRKVIEFSYNRDYPSWDDWYENVYGSGQMDSYQRMSGREKQYWDRFISEYCSLDILNNRLNDLKDSNLDAYNNVIMNINSY